MSNKVAVVTGSNKGVGLAIVRSLCKQFKGQVYLLSRDEKRGHEAIKVLNKEGLTPKFHLLDITSLESIREFKQHIITNHGGIDILVNNAAIAYPPDASEPIAEQAEVTMRVNFFGTMNICNELFPILKQNARVVNISSVAGFLQVVRGNPESDKLREQLADPKITKDELINLVNNYIQLAKLGTHEEHGWPGRAYAVSKVAISCLTRIQQRELDESPRGILVNSVHPGYVHTDMTKTWGTGHLTADEGAIAPTWLALLPENVKTPRGGFIWHDKTIVDWVNGPLPYLHGCCSSMRTQNLLKTLSCPIADTEELCCQFRR